MSDARNMRREAKRAALIHVKALGCTCSPRLEIETTIDGTLVAIAKHRDECLHLRDLRSRLGVDRLPLPVLTGEMKGWWR